MQYSIKTRLPDTELEHLHDLRDPSLYEDPYLRRGDIKTDNLPKGCSGDTDHAQETRGREPPILAMGSGQTIPMTDTRIKSAHDFTQSISEQLSRRYGDTLHRSHHLFPATGVQLAEQDMNRWKAASNTIRYYNESNQELKNSRPFVQRCKNWPPIFNKDVKNDVWTILVFSAAGLFYGGLHALAWSANFAFPVQQLLWRISACMVIGGFPLAIDALRLSNVYSLSS